jgi:ABC-type sugar transport system ATPase subunit
MIELKNVSIQAGNFQLKNVSFKIDTGKYAVFMGRTGRGKTTILESICGLRRITSGKILVHGVDVSDWMPGDRGIGYVPQDLALFPNLTVDEHLSFALKLRKQPANKIQKRVTSLAGQLGITHLLKRSINDLSGGEKQRVALGRAISFEPNALLLDEPFSALDEQTRQEMHQLVKQITSESGVTTLHVTHSEEEAAALADRRYSLEDGVVISQNSLRKEPTA